MNIFDVLIIGGGPAGLSCALTLGSAGKKPFVTDKKIGIFIHQSESGMHTALFFKVLSLSPRFQLIDKQALARQKWLGRKGSEWFFYIKS
jgi:thioredoxin reductase